MINLWRAEPQNRPPQLDRIQTMGSLAASNQVVMSWQRYADCTRRREAEPIRCHLAARAPNKRSETDYMTAAWRMKRWLTFTRVLMAHCCCCAFHEWNKNSVTEALLVQRFSGSKAMRESTRKICATTKALRSTELMKQRNPDIFKIRFEIIEIWVLCPCRSHKETSDKSRQHSNNNK